jgi:hypothetical protein
MIGMIRVMGIHVRPFLPVIMIIWVSVFMVALALISLMTMIVIITTSRIMVLIAIAVLIIMAPITMWAIVAAIIIAAIPTGFVAVMVTHPLPIIIILKMVSISVMVSAVLPIHFSYSSQPIIDVGIEYVQPIKFDNGRTSCN